MNTRDNRKIVLEERPHYTIPTPECFRLTTEPMPVPKNGEMLLRTLWLSMDTYLLGKIKRYSARTKPLALGETMAGLSIAEVVSSTHPEYASGDLVMGALPWSDYVASDGRGVRKVVDDLPSRECVLSAFGYAGFTAYLSVFVLGQAKTGETVVIGSANSGMGQMAAQMAKKRGCRVIGVSLGESRCTVPPSQLGFDCYIDSRSDDLKRKLQDSCPNGVDLYVEFVGGEVFSATLPLLNHNARIIVAGLKALYTASELPDGPDKTMLFLNEIMTRRLQVKGLVVFDYVKEHFRSFRTEMASWLMNGDIKVVNDIVEGLENAPVALRRMFESNNYGHVIVRVSDK